MMTYLIVGPIFPDLGHALFDARQTGRRCCRVHQYEGVRGGQRQPTHGRKLQVARCVQNVHLQCHVSEVEFATVQVLDGGPVLVAVRLVDELLDKATLAHARATQNHQPEAINLRHVWCMCVGACVWRLFVLRDADSR